MLQERAFEGEEAARQAAWEALNLRRQEVTARRDEARRAREEAAAELAGGDPARYAALMPTIAGLVGLIALAAGALRLGFVAELLSKPVLVGYITGVGLTLLTSQLEAFTGVPIDADGKPSATDFFRYVIASSFLPMRL